MKTYIDAAKLQEYTTKLVAKLKTIFPGAPLVASTVAGMTHTTRVYVYTGSETGYTAGNWYYWDGTAWTSGGIYQSSGIETDTTLSVSGKAADGKATGDAIAAAKAAVLAELAPAYSTSGTYAVGDYVIYNSALYRCTTAISTAEAWTAAHWTSVDLAPDLGSQVADLKNAISAIVEEKVGTNIFPGYTEEGGLNNSTGDEMDGNYVRSDFIPLDTTKTNLYILRETQPYGIRIFYYDATKTYIENHQIFNGSATVLSGTDTIPANAAYIRTFRANTATGWVMLSYTQESTYVPYAPYYDVKEEVIDEDNLSQNVQNKLNAGAETTNLISDVFTEKTVNIFDGTFPNNGYIDSDGSDASGSSWKRTDYIPIDGTNSLLYFLRTAQPYYLGRCFYDSNKQAIGTTAYIFGASSTDLNQSVAIPSGTAYIRMYTSKSDYSGNLSLSYTKQDSFVSYGDHYFLDDDTVNENNLSSDLKDKVNSGLKLTGKTIAFMGDSIIGNFYDSTGICAIVAEKTGATVINCAFGGTRMGYRYGSNAQYPYWNALSGAGLASAIASGTWTDQDTAVANMTGGLAYFSDRLSTLKAVDWTKVDYIMWDYGTNDFMTDVALTGSDFYAYDYSYKYAIETILTAYPNIQIIAVTPGYRWYQSEGVFTDDSNTHTNEDYNGVSHKLTDFVAKAQEVCRSYQLPCIDDYYTVGANQYTRLAYFDSTDGTHPNAQGRERLAGHISAQLLSLV